MRPNRYVQLAADTQVSVWPGIVANLSVANGSGAAVTVNVYDDAQGGASNPIETLIVPAGDTRHVTPNARADNGIRVTCSSWGSVKASLRYTGP